MNNITDLLDLEDSDIKISDIIIEGQTKTLIIETPPVASYCPICGFRMHSRGVKKRTINHPSALLTRDVELQMQLTNNSFSHKKYLLVVCWQCKILYFKHKFYSAIVLLGIYINSNL